MSKKSTKVQRDACGRRPCEAGGFKTVTAERRHSRRTGQGAATPSAAESSWVDPEWEKVGNNEPSLTFAGRVETQLFSGPKALLKHGACCDPVKRTLPDRPSAPRRGAQPHAALERAWEEGRTALHPLQDPRRLWTPSDTRRPRTPLLH